MKTDFDNTSFPAASTDLPLQKFCWVANCPPSQVPLLSSLLQAAKVSQQTLESEVSIFGSMVKNEENSGECQKDSKFPELSVKSV